MRRIDFFIAGVQKSGTTALDSFLREHPQLAMAKIKEVHFFDNESLDWAAPDYEQLHVQFDWDRNDVQRGEATPIYTYWPQALERLQRYNPTARLIIGLRHPSFRAFSHWRMEVSRSSDTLSFSDAIREGRERVRSTPSQAHRVYSYVERGFYDQQIARTLSLFPRSQLHFFRTDELFTQPAKTLAEIEDFLGVGRVLPAIGRYVVPVESKDFGVMTLADRQFLDELFAPSITEVERLSGLDLSDWRNPGYEEPMRPLD